MSDILDVTVMSQDELIKKRYFFFLIFPFLLVIHWRIHFRGASHQQLNVLKCQIQSIFTIVGLPPHGSQNGDS